MFRVAVLPLVSNAHLKEQDKNAAVKKAVKFDNKIHDPKKQEINLYIESSCPQLVRLGDTTAATAVYRTFNGWSHSPSWAAVHGYQAKKTPKREPPKECMHLTRPTYLWLYFKHVAGFPWNAKRIHITCIVSLLDWSHTHRRAHGRGAKPSRHGASEVIRELLVLM